MGLTWQKPTGLAAELEDVPQELREWAVSLPSKEINQLRRDAGNIGQFFPSALHHEFFGRFGRKPEEKPFNA